MDPLSIAASIAGLLALTGSVVSNGYALLSKLDKRTETLHNLVGEVAAFSGVLFGLQSRFVGTNADASSLEQACGSGISLRDTIKACKKTLDEAQGLFDLALKKGKLLALVQGDATRTEGEKLVAEMERHKTFFIICLQLQHSLKSDDMGHVVAKMVRQLQGIQQGQQQLKKHFEEKAMNKKRSQIIRWLGPTTEDEHDDIVKRRDRNSAQWLLDREEFIEWMVCDASSYFWLQGIQGCGKTVIVSKVIETLSEVCVDDNVALTYHYCSYNDVSPEKIVRALLSQLLQHTRSGDFQCPSLTSLFEKYHLKSSSPDMQDLHQVWEELCRRVSRVYLIIDGLDQINYADKITDFLDGLSSLGVQIKVFVSSRPSWDLEQSFSAYSVVLVTSVDIREDIEQHVRSRIHQLRIDNEPEAVELIQELVKKADGMFLWVVCQLDHLSRVRTAISPQILKALPRGLERSFEAVLFKLEDEDRQLALLILRCIMYAHAPLDLDELTEVIAIEPGMSNLAEVQKSKLRRSSDILEICGSLVRQSKSTGKLFLAHFSVYEFLSSPTLGKSRRNEFFLERMPSKAGLLAACITYLNLDDYSSLKYLYRIESMQSIQQGGKDYDISANTPFLEQAATSWCAYLGDLGTEELEEAWPLLKSFFQEERYNFNSWLEIARYLEGQYKFPVGFTPLHVAATHNLKTVAEWLLRDNPSCATATANDGRTALHVALENGNEEVADLLLTQGASAKCADHLGRSPLQIAIQRGDACTVRRLLDAGGDVNAPLPDGRTPLFIAVENSWDELATLLAGLADAKSRLPDGRTLLHVAAQSGSLEWTNALITHHKTMVHQGDDNVWMPLHYAAEHGHDELAQALIQAGAVAGREDNNGWTALHAAIHRKHLGCVEILLQYRREDHVGSPGIAALASTPASEIEADERARKYGHAHASILTDEGSSRRKEPPPSPLLLAVSESYPDAVALLVRHWGTTHNPSQRSLPQCLEKAITQPDTAILEMLLPLAKRNNFSDLQLLRLLEKKSPRVTKELRRLMETGIRLFKYVAAGDMGNDIKLASLVLETWPISHPAQLDEILCDVLEDNRCSVELLRFLCTGQDVIPRTSSHRLPLEVAVTGNRTAAEFLIKERAAITQRNSAGETTLLALAATATNGDTSPLEFLLSHGAKLDDIDNKGSGLCHKAILSENVAILSWALESGAVAGQANSGGDTPLLLAVRQNSTEMVRRLLVHFASSPANIAAIFLSQDMKYQRLNNLFSLTSPFKNPNMLSMLIEAEQNAASAIQLDEQMSAARKTLYTEALIDALKQYSREGSPDSGAVELLISHTPDLDCSNAVGQTLLHTAIQYGSEHHLTLMLQRGLDVDSRTTGDGGTPFDIAMRCRRPVAARLFLQWGCAVRPEYMMAAFESQDVDLLASLLARGVNLDRSHCLLASEMTDPAFVTYLLEQGAYPSPSHIVLAAKHDDKRLLEQTLAAFPDKWAFMVDALQAAVQSRSTSAASILSQRLIAGRLNNMPPDTEGGTILHSALRQRALEDVGMIIQCHLGDEKFFLTRDSDSKTALTLAISNKYWAASRLLFTTGFGVEEASELADAMGFPKAVWAIGKIV